MAHSERVTLITACYQSAAVIRTALESVLAQKGVDLDYLVIDGGSTDGTVDIVREFEPKFAGRMRWLSEKDAGMYDAINKGIRMAQGEFVGILNADDVLAADDVLSRVVAAFDADPALDGTYADIRFVTDSASAPCVRHTELRALPTVRYCSGRHFRPWQFRFGVQTAHPSTFFRRSCFDRWGLYSLDYGMYSDFDLLCRFIWRNRARMRYLPLCTTVMRTGGASTDGWRTTIRINRADRRALRANGCWTCYPLLYARYLFKIWGFVFRTRGRA